MKRQRCGLAQNFIWQTCRRSTVTERLTLVKQAILALLIVFFSLFFLYRPKTPIPQALFLPSLDVNPPQMQTGRLNGRSISQNLFDAKLFQDSLYLMQEHLLYFLSTRIIRI